MVKGHGQDYHGNTQQCLSSVCGFSHLWTLYVTMAWEYPQPGGREAASQVEVEGVSFDVVGYEEP